MLTNQFKATVAIATGLVIIGGVVFNQVSLQKQIQSIESGQKTQVITLPLPSLTPVASPTAMLSPTKTLVYPTKPVVTTPVPTK